MGQQRQLLVAEQNLAAEVTPPHSLRQRWRGVRILLEIARKLPDNPTCKPEIEPAALIGGLRYGLSGSEDAW